MKLRLRHVGRAPAIIAERLSESRKKRQCLVGSETRIGRSSRITNTQGRAEAITLGARCLILGDLLVFPHGGTIVIGDDSFVSEHTRIWSASSIRIGSGVLISHGVNIHDTASHSLSAADRREHFRQVRTGGHPTELHNVKESAIVIADDAWIGFGAAIMPGVRVGKGAIVGAHSVVTHSVADYDIVVGNPAKVIGKARP